VRVIGVDGQQVGVLQLGEAINMARSKGVDLVEVAPGATPPVCRLVDYGKFRYEQAKREKDAKKHQHANKVKEIQLSATIDAHDFGVKAGHAIDFLCDEMKVKITLRFRGREMAHQQFGYQVVEKFIKELVPYGQPDAPPKLIGRSINLMFSPLPRNKRAKNPRQAEPGPGSDDGPGAAPPASPKEPKLGPEANSPGGVPGPTPNPGDGFNNNPFGNLDDRLGAA
jgi:translation initiation factor IF-3